MNARSWRVALHAHSTWSYDGRWSLAAISRIFGSLGYDAVMMTEHDTGFSPNRFDEYCGACRAASTSRCRIVPGIEYSSPGNDIHILTWGLDRFLGEHRPVARTLVDVQAGSGAAVFAHPARREAWRRFDRKWIPLLNGIEIWNRKTDGFRPGPEAVELWQSTGLPATVGIDFHRLLQIYPIALEIEADPATDMERAVVAALRSGRHTPLIRGRPLLEAAGSLKREERARAERAEAIRRRLRNLARGKARRRSGQGGPDV